MNVRVELGDYATDWHFAGSPSLSEWLASLPWTGHGGVRVLRLPCAAVRQEFADQLRAEVRAQDDGRSAVRVRFCEEQESGASRALDALCAWLELAPQRSRHGTVVALSQELAVAPVVLTVFHQRLDRAFIDELVELAGAVPKLHAGARLTCVVFDTADGLVSSEAFDFSHGEPSGGVLTGSGQRDAIWKRYVHQRLAWEAGGRLDRARQLDGAASALRLFDDEGLEATLNAQARLLWQTLATKDRDAVIAALRTPAPKASAATGAGLFRPAQAGRTSLPVAWVARAVLLERAAPELAPALRQALVCTPLAREIIGRCFELEAAVRMRLRLAHAGAAPPDEFVRKLRDFQRGEFPFDAALYPPGSPAVPDDPWSFATYGEFLARHPGAARGEFTQLRLLRNALAHGAYASWKAVTKLLDIETQV